MDIPTIQSAVARHYDVPLRAMWSGRTSHSLVLPRHIAIYLSYEMLADTMPVIGRHFGGRDRTTVRNALRRVEELMAIDPELRATVASLKACLEAPVDVL